MNTNIIWNDLDTYYQRYGISYLCCCKINQYSRIFYEYREYSQFNQSIQRIIDYTYNHMKKIGFHDIQSNDCQIVCATSYVYDLEYLLKTHALCMYDLAEQKIKTNMIDMMNTNHTTPKIYVYLWKLK